MSNSVGGSGPCVALIELASIAAGYEVVDGLLKQADVELLEATPVTPGKFVVLFTGAVEEVTASLRRGLEIGRDVLIDKLFIPNLEPTLLALMRGEQEPPAALDALGIIETLSVASTIRAADRAAKAASLRLVSVVLARGIGGKSFVTFTGEIGDVEAGVEAGAEGPRSEGLLVREVVIPRPHGTLAEVLTW